MSSDRKESVVEDATLKLRQELTGASGPRALVKNIKVFELACFACLGGFVYGYNQGVFSGILTMTSFNERMETISFCSSSVRPLTRDRHGRLGQ
ncbi:MAG: hypothetical protein L6R42_001968 [Xanthoria sp. 1 TBL-2021]|nr:MAG: hypothetical protein L6R42_001968 [Xanthoria sp. 1 TBL-2021]